MKKIISKALSKQGQENYERIFNTGLYPNRIVKRYDLSGEQKKRLDKANESLNKMLHRRQV